MNVRLYAPAFVLTFWAIIAAIWGITQPFTSIALLTIAIAVKIQIDESRRMKAELRKKIEDEC